MDYQQFIFDVEKAVTEVVETQISVSIQRVIKNNGNEKIGITLAESNVNISPTIYLEDFYAMYKEKKDINEIAYEIKSLYEEAKLNTSFDGECISEYRLACEKLAFKLIHGKKNKRLLEDVPHKICEDLAIVFYLLLQIKGETMATVLIRNEQLKLWNITVEELWIQARKNTPIILPAVFQTMYSAVRGMLELEKEDIDEDYMYILSNEEKSFGAACILYEDMQAQIYTYLGENYYVIPSSIHEVIIIPESKSPGKKELDDMICEINSTQVAQVEHLSDHAYYYDHEKTDSILYI